MKLITSIHSAQGIGRTPIVTLCEVSLTEKGMCHERYLLIISPTKGPIGDWFYVDYIFFTGWK